MQNYRLSGIFGGIVFCIAGFVCIQFQSIAKPGTGQYAVGAGQLMIGMGVVIIILALTGLLGRWTRQHNEEMRKRWRR